MWRGRTPATFVLVPGAWCGGWAFRQLMPYLRAAGHEVYTPAPTGLGERVHLASPEITLETRFGFVLTGDIEDGEIIARLDVR